MVNTALSSAAPSIISADVSIEGNISSKSEIHLEGQVVGNVTCNTLVMGEQGLVNGDIVSESVTIRGTVNGDIRARVVHLEKKAVINGDVIHESLTVESGAKLNGRFSHTTAVEQDLESKIANATGQDLAAE